MIHRLLILVLAAALVLALVPTPVHAATGTIMPFPKFFCLDNNGTIVNGGKLFIYTSGTTTKATTYSDAAMTTANANPVVCDSSGRTTVFLASGSYKFTLAPSTDTDPPVAAYWTVDTVASTPAATVDLDVTGTAGEALSAGNVVFISDGAGGNTAGRFYKADADNTYSSTTAEALGFAIAAISSGSSGSIRIQGRMTDLSGFSAGAVQYVSATAGALTATAPANSRPACVADTTTTCIISSALTIAAASGTQSGVVSLAAQTLGTGVKTFSAQPILTAGTGTGTAPISGTLNIQSTSDTCATFGSEEDFFSYTLPANSLSANNRSIFVRAWGDTAGNANNKRLRLYFGGTLIADSTAAAFNAQNWRFNAEIIRTGAATEVANVVLNVAAATASNIAHVQNTALAIDTTAAIIIKVTGLCATANDDATQRGMVVGFR